MNVRVDASRPADFQELQGIAIVESKVQQAMASVSNTERSDLGIYSVGRVRVEQKETYD